MSETTTITAPRPRRRLWLRVVVLVLLAIIIVVVAAVGLTQTQWFRDYVRDMIVASANESLNGTLSIGRLTGNLYESVALHDIVVTQIADTVIHVPRLSLSYDLWVLFDNVIDVKQLSVVEPYVYLRLIDDSTWNVSTVTLSEGDTAPSIAGGSMIPGWTVRFDTVSVLNGSVVVASVDSLVPSRIDNLNVAAGVVLSPAAETVTINRLHFKMPDYLVRQVEMAASVSLTDSIATVDSLILSSEYNRIALSGQYAFGAEPRGHVKVEADSLDPRDFALFTDYQFPDTRPSISVTADLDSDVLTVGIGLDDDRQFVTASGWVKPLFAGLADTSYSQLVYALDVNLGLQRLQEWLPDTLARGSVTGSLHVGGRGLGTETMRADADITVRNGSVAGHRFANAGVVATHVKDSVNFTAFADGSFGAVELTGTLAEIRGSFRYDVRSRARHVNLRPLLGPDTPETDVTAAIAASGQGYDPARATGKAQLAFSPSSVGETTVDTLAAAIRFDPDRITIDTVYVAGRPGSLTGRGTIGLDQRGSLRLRGELREVDWLTDWIDADSLSAQGLFTADVDGTIDSLTISGSIDLTQLRFDDYSADSLAGQFAIVYADTAITGTYASRVINLNAASMFIPVVTMSGHIEPLRYTADIHTAVRDDLSASLSAEYREDSIPVLEIDRVELQLAGQQWVSGTESTQVLFQENGYALSHLELERTDNQQPVLSLRPSIALDGVYRFDSTHSVNLVARGIDLTTLSTLVEPSQTPRGTLSLEVHSAGHLDNPAVNGSASIRRGAFHDYQYDSLTGAFSLTDGVAASEFTLHVRGPESLAVAATIPLSMFTDSASLAPDSGLDVHVRSFGFTLAILQAFGYDVDNAEGNLDIDIHATRSISNPVVDGQVRISNGRVRAPEYGIDYRNIAVDVGFDSSRINLTRLSAQRDKGSLLLTGHAEFSGGLLSGQLDAAEMLLAANDFYVVRHRHYEVQVSADASLKGPVESPEYGGTITVRRSNVYLPALSEDIAEGTSATTPLLVAALRDTLPPTDGTTATAAAVNDSTSVLTSAYVQNLRGRLQVRFPRNTWLRDDDMKLEIEGTLDVVKEGSDFELFGTISVVRGDYSLYGKKFRIKEGQLGFDGGQTINPRLSIDAVHVFRTPSREKRSLTLSIGGRAESPTLSFSLDGNQIDEGDAVSYIVFGRSIAELTSGQRSAIAGESGGQTEVAKGAIANLLAGQLTQTLGNEFSLDVIEINAQSDWKSASFVVGKYLTTDLFVSYQRGLGATREDDEVVPEVVTLEYELSRHLFFQLVAADARKSGFDVILKFDKE